jgi:hypothetical protein
MVNAAETGEQLSAAILAIANQETGMIKGRSREFSAAKMADAVKIVLSTGRNFNLLTREYGIRQQAMYLVHYIKTGE